MAWDLCCLCGRPLPGPVHPRSTSKLWCEVGLTTALLLRKELLHNPIQGLSIEDMGFCDATNHHMCTPTKSTAAQIWPHCWRADNELRCQPHPNPVHAHKACTTGAVPCC